jgi:hypothetical protein
VRNIANSGAERKERKRWHTCMSDRIFSYIVYTGAMVAGVDGVLSLLSLLLLLLLLLLEFAPPLILSPTSACRGNPLCQEDEG